MLSETDLRDRIIATLEACKHNYYTPQDFYRQHFPYFQRLQPEDYFSPTTTSRSTRRNHGRMVTLEMKDDQYLLRCGNNVSKSTITEITESQLERIYRRFVDVTQGNWNEDRLHKTMDLILEESKTLPSLLAPDMPSHLRTILHFIRWVLAAGWSGPPIAQTMVLLGREISLQRFADIPTIVSSASAEQAQYAGYTS